MDSEALILSSPLVGEAGGGRDASASQTNPSSAAPKNLSAADAAAPPPIPPHKGEGFKRLNLPANAIPRARRLRRDMTLAERNLWRALREVLPSHHWRKQVPLGPYIADFCSHSARLIIEVDGGQHAAAGGYDATRTHFLEGEGYRVLRYWNDDVIGNPNGVLTRITAALALEQAQ